MHKSIAIMAAIVLSAGLLGWRAEAAPGAGYPMRNFSPVVKVACGGPGPMCGWGRIYTCNAKKCWCAACGRYKWRGWWGW